MNAVLLLCMITAANASSLRSSSSNTSPRNLIVRGHDAAPDRYPYFVSLNDGNCGGALIAPDIVLTAGHCKPPKHSTVHVGAYRYNEENADDDKDPEATTTTLGVKKTVRHPKFQQLGDDEFRNDFTVILLDGSVPLERFPILNRNPQIPAERQTVTSMGLGITETGNRPDVLQEVQLNTISNQECSLVSSEEESFGNGRIVESHLCTFVAPNNTKDSCAFDSGGPIIVSTGEMDLLVGLVSWGIGCADPVFPGVNARVSVVSGWIDETTWRLSNEALPTSRQDDPPMWMTILVAIVAIAMILPTIPSLIKDFPRTLCGSLRRPHSPGFIKLVETAETQSFATAASSEDGNYYHRHSLYNAVDEVSECGQIMTIIE